MRRSGPSSLAVIGAIAVAAASVVACATTPSAPSAPAATQIAVPSVSFVPAVETSTPEPIETPGELPAIGPPSSSIPPPPEVTTEYTEPADDLAAFVAAYRTAFQVPELSDDQIAAAGARLCGYLQGQADATGVVDAARALADAEVNEPGYPREVWQVAFEVASTSYCRELTFAVEGQG